MEEDELLSFMSEESFCAVWGGGKQTEPAAVEEPLPSCDADTLWTKRLLLNSLEDEEEEGRVAVKSFALLVRKEEEERRGKKQEELLKPVKYKMLEVAVEELVYFEEKDSMAELHVDEEEEAEEEGKQERKWTP